MAALKTAIVHYHLRPGGVTRVIRGAAVGLAARGLRVAVLSGSPSPTMPEGIAHRVIEGLDYEGGFVPAGSPREEHLAGALERAARDALGGPPDVWHIHNHSVGRHAPLTRAVRLLAERGARLLLQIHDFPEDGRPANYRFLREQVGEGDSRLLANRLYPSAPHVHYGVLNRRDRDILRAGRAESVHALPNPVVFDTRSEAKPPGPGEARRFLYPTRALRRKNVGEFLLWSALAESGDRFGVTLSPTSAADCAAYDRWRAVAAALGLPVEFDVGGRPGASFEDLLAESSAVVTTSVSEGFGLAFLEPWGARRPLCGRNLPEVTADFVEAGIEFPDGYDRLEVPVGWVGEGRLADAVRRGLRALLLSYGLEPTPDLLERGVAAAATDGRVDVGRLDEAMQVEVIRRVRGDPAAHGDIRPRTLFPARDRSGIVRRNARLVAEVYGADRYAERLAGIYEELAQSPTRPPGHLDAWRILEGFVAPERFHLLKS
jgi:glycosyltransferase involved in cell wall biosynthesis